MFVSYLKNLPRQAAICFEILHQYMAYDNACVILNECFFYSLITIEIKIILQIQFLCEHEMLHTYKAEPPTH